MTQRTPQVDWAEWLRRTFDFDVLAYLRGRLVFCQEDGQPLTVIQGLMGHVTIEIEMTERYAHFSPDMRREAVGVLDRPFAPACDICATRMEEAANHP